MHTVYVNKSSFPLMEGEEIRDALAYLHKACADKFGAGSSNGTHTGVWLDSTKGSQVVVAVTKESGDYDDDDYNYERTHYLMSYARNGDGSFVLGEPIEVERRVRIEYVPKES